MIVGNMCTVYSIVPFVWFVSNMFCAQCRSGFRPTDRRQYFESLLQDLGVTSPIIQIGGSDYGFTGGGTDQLSVLLVHVFSKVQ
jgi:hypothetical protein